MDRLRCLSASLCLTLIGPALLEAQFRDASGRPFPPFPPKNPNWVDTIRVERLRTGSCHWSTVRIRPGARGTMTRAAEPNEKTCTVLVYNYTVGSSQDVPNTVGFAYIEDHKTPPPTGAIVHFVDTFTVARKPNGNCDWSKTPLRPGRPGSSSAATEIRVRDCWGVVTNYTSTVRQDTAGMKVDSQVYRALPDSVLLEDMKATYALLKNAQVSENDVIRTSRGSAAAEMVVRLPRGEAHYRFAKENGVWAITKVDTIPLPRARTPHQP